MEKGTNPEKLVNLTWFGNIYYLQSFSKFYTFWSRRVIYQFNIVIFK